MMRLGLILCGLALLGGCATSAAPPADHAEPGDGLSRLRWMLGRWEGDGFLRQAGAVVSPVRTEWEIQERFGGRFLELAFTHHLPEGETDHWAGYFTWDAAAGEYTTIWVNVASGYLFRERGTLSPEGDVLTLDSTHEGAEGAVVSMRSVFTRVGAGAFRVQDTMTRPGADPEVTFSFSLHRRPGN